MKLVVLGLSVTSSWGNGHATTYRALLRAFAARGHDVLFVERDVPWYRDHRDMPQPDFCRLEMYRDLSDLRSRLTREIAECDWAMVGSYVPEGVAVGDWVTSLAPRTAFYDIDTPVTLAKLGRGDYEYLTPQLIGRYNLYLSFSGGRTLETLEKLGAPCALPLYCSVDTELYQPVPAAPRWDLSYLGTYSPDRQPTVEELLMGVARELPTRDFCVAGPQYPPDVLWPSNVLRYEHLPPAKHALFYSASRWTLNVTRRDMISAGWSPSVRLFEAAACGSPVVSDYWDGLGDFFELDSEIRIANSRAEALVILADIDESQRRDIAAAARARVMRDHSSEKRAAELEDYLTPRTLMR